MKKREAVQPEDWLPALDAMKQLNGTGRRTRKPAPKRKPKKKGTRR